MQTCVFCFFLQAIQKSLLKIYRGSKPGSATRKKEQGTQKNDTDMPDKSEGQNQEEITRKMYQRLDAEHMDTIRSHTNRRTGRRWDETKTAAHGINSKLLLLLYCSNSYLTFGSDIGKLGLK